MPGLTVSLPSRREWLQKSLYSDRFSGKQQAPAFLLLESTMVGCLVLTALSFLKSQLHTPMYYFIRNSSFVYFCNCFIIIPIILMNFFVREEHYFF